MASFRIRPRFEMTTEKTMEQIIQVVKDNLKDNKRHLHGEAMHDHITIKVDKDQRHYWSPQLSILMYREPEDKVTTIRGVYGPMPNVWTLFALSYLAIGVLAVFISIAGLSQKALGIENKILWVIPILAIVASVLYIISQMGQKLGASQTYAIHYFLQDALGEEVPDI